MWMLIIGRVLQVISCPVLSIWWYVGSRSHHVVYHESYWMKMFQLVINKEKTDKVSNQMSSDMHFINQYRFIMSMLYFIDGFHVVLFNKHMK